MPGELETKDRREARTILIGLGVFVIALGIVAVFAWPLLVEFNETQLAPGVGIKTAAAIAFIATVLLMIVFAIAAGDSLIGEIQFMIGGFFSFFAVLWILIAWVF